MIAGISNPSTASLEPRGEQILDRMMPHRSRHIDIGVGVMHCVKPPQKRHRVLTAMHGVDQKIEQQEARQKARPLIGDRPRGQTHTEGDFELPPEDVGWREDEGGNQDIKKPDADIAKPPPERRKFPLSPRLAEFPQSDSKQAAEDDKSGQSPLRPIVSRCCRGLSSTFALLEWAAWRNRSGRQRQKRRRGERFVRYELNECRHRGRGLADRSSEVVRETGAETVGRQRGRGR